MRAKPQPKQGLKIESNSIEQAQDLSIPAQVLDQGMSCRLVNDFPSQAVSVNMQQTIHMLKSLRPWDTKFTHFCD